MQIINGTVVGDVAHGDVVHNTYFGQRDWMHVPLDELYFWRKKYRSALRRRWTVTYVARLTAFLLLVLIPALLLFNHQNAVFAAFSGTVLEPWWYALYAASTLLMAYLARRLIDPASDALQYYRLQLAHINRAIVIQRDLSRF